MIGATAGGCGSKDGSQFDPAGNLGADRMGTLHGWDVYGRPDFQQVEWTHTQPRCSSPRERSRMPLQQAAIFQQMRKEGFLRGKHSIDIMRDEPGPADTGTQLPEAGQEQRPGDQPQGGAGNGDQRAA